MAEYITISEFAKKVNLSRQAVYKRIDKDLKGYVIKEGHKLKINVDAIHMIDSNAKVEHTEIAECSEVSTVVNLQDLIDKKDKQINDLLEIIKEQNKAITMLITRQCKRSFWQRFISRKNEENRDINSISQKNQDFCDINSISQKVENSTKVE